MSNNILGRFSRTNNNNKYAIPDDNDDDEDDENTFSIMMNDDEDEDENDVQPVNLNTTDNQQQISVNMVTPPITDLWSIDDNHTKNDKNDENDTNDDNNGGGAMDHERTSNDHTENDDNEEQLLLDSDHFEATLQKFQQTNDSIPEPLSPTLPYRAFQFKSPFERNKSMEEFACSLSFTCVAQDRSMNDPFFQFLKLSSNSSSSAVPLSVENSEMGSLSLNRGNHFASDASFNQYSAFSQMKSIGRDLKRDVSSWQKAMLRFQTEKRSLTRSSQPTRSNDDELVEVNSSVEPQSTVNSTENNVEQHVVEQRLPETPSQERVPNNGTTVMEEYSAKKESAVEQTMEVNESSVGEMLGDVEDDATYNNMRQNIAPSPTLHVPPSASTSASSPVMPFSSLPAQKVVKKVPTRDTKSSLTYAEQREYIEMQKRMSENREIAAQISKSGRFIDLHSKVLKEQQMYRQAMFDEAMQNMSIYKRLDTMIDTQVHEHMEHLKRRINSELPPMYELCKSLNISEIRPMFRVDPVLRLQRLLIRLGRCRHFRSHLFTNDFHFKLKSDVFRNETLDLVKTKERTESPHVAESSSKVTDTTTTPTVEARKEGATEDHTGEEKIPIWTKPNIPVVSADPIISGYLLKNITPADFKSDSVFVMSSSTIQEVLDTHWPNLHEEWTIPVRISTNEHGLKCVFLDKPLPSKTATTRDKNTLYYKTALKGFGLNITKDAFMVNYNQEQAAQALLKDMSVSNHTENLSDIDDNVNYSMFDLGAARILVRYHTDGVIPDATPKRYKHVGIKSKLEYLGKDKPEEVTRNEIARWWAHAYIRQDEELYVGRISIKNNSVIDMERIGTHSEIISKFKYEPSQAVKLLNVMLTELRTLEPGYTYLVQHVQGDRCMKIFKESPTGAYNLVEDFNEVGRLDVTIPYIPRRWKNQPDRIPYTFPIGPKANKSAKNKNKRKRERSHSKNKKPKQSQPTLPVSFDAPTHFSAPTRPTIASASGTHPSD